MEQRIIIIGGMGPQASLELHRRIIQRASDNGARDGQDYPYIVHLSLPVPDFIASRDALSTASTMITEAVTALSLTEDDSVVIACNTAHILYDEIQAATQAKVLSLIGATVQSIVSREIKTVRLLGTPTTLRSGLYERPLKKQGVTVVTPSEAEAASLEKIIRTVISGQRPILSEITLPSDCPPLLGCTELSCALGDMENVVDPLTVILDLLPIKTTKITL